MFEDIIKKSDIEKLEETINRLVKEAEQEALEKIKEALDEGI